jgi:hypothetical protein
VRKGATALGMASAQSGVRAQSQMLATLTAFSIKGQWPRFFDCPRMSSACAQPQVQDAATTASTNTLASVRRDRVRCGTARQMTDKSSSKGGPPAPPPPPPPSIPQPPIPLAPAPKCLCGYRTNSYPCPSCGVLLNGPPSWETCTVLGVHHAEWYSLGVPLPHQHTCGTPDSAPAPPPK